MINDLTPIEPFRAPVDWKSLGLFDYPQLIKKPMDLGKIKRKLEKEEYKSIYDAAEDTRLVWKNCMQYNADGSDFYKLAQSLSKKFEDKFTKVLKELNLPSSPQKDSGSGSSAPEPSLEDKRIFARNLYKISKEQLGKVIVDLDNLSPAAITRNSAEDQLDINVDDVSPEAFQKVMTFVAECVASSNGRKKKSSSGGSSKSKKTRS
jgi:hypothetical protein